MNLYHVLNHGTEKRPIFSADGDYLRFIHNLYEFNDANAATSNSHNFRNRKGMIPSGPLEGAGRPRRERKQIVDIHGWVLMKNRYHLLLSERVEGGMAKFLRKLNIGYANYFNDKYKRRGSIFHGRMKKVEVKRDALFLPLLNYIHLNPLDYLPSAHEWRTRKLDSANRALAHLEKYRWSSYLDYAGKPNFPSILTTSLFKDVAGSYESEIKGYLRDIDTDSLKGLTLE